MLDERGVWLGPDLEQASEMAANPRQGADKKCDKLDFPSAIIIKGITCDGAMFRPSDWCQRLAAAATIDCGYCDDRRGRSVNPYVKVVAENGAHGLWLSVALTEVDPPLFDFMFRFAQDNGLQITAFDGERPR